MDFLLSALIVIVITVSAAVDCEKSFFPLHCFHCLGHKAGASDPGMFVRKGALTPS